MENEVIRSKKKLSEILTPAQKVVVFGTLILAIAIFIYSFMFMTPFSDIYMIDSPFLFTKMAKFSTEKGGLIDIEYIKQTFPEAIYVAPLTGEEVGINLAYITAFTKNQLQAFNHWLFILGFVAILASAIPFIYFSQKRKIYYKSNYIVLPSVAAFNLYVGLHMFIQLVNNHGLIMSKNMKEGYLLLNAYQTYINDPEGTSKVINEYYKQTDCNGVFAIGYILAILLIACAIASCLLVIAKYINQKKQPPVDFSRVNINE